MRNLALLSLFFLSCGGATDTSNSVKTSNEGTGGGTTAVAATCPASEPNVGERCSLAADAVCTYGSFSCSVRYACASEGTFQILSQGCFGVGGSTSVSPPDAGGITVSIAPLMTRYGAEMSSVPGLPLAPVIEGGSYTSFKYRWRSNYGTFATWSTVDYLVRALDANAVIEGVTVYWQYMAVPADFAPVTIELDVIEDSTQYVLASDTITLLWDDTGGVVVQ